MCNVFFFKLIRLKIEVINAVATRALGAHTYTNYVQLIMINGIIIM